MRCHGRRKTGHEVRHPDMPAPHDAVARVAHGHDGVALFDRRAPHLEGQAMSVGCECDVRHQIFLILPHEDGIVRRTIRIVVDIRVGDRRIEVIYEGLQYVRSAGLRGVGRSVRTAVLDSIAIDQREGVFSGGVDDIAVGRIHRRRPALCREVVGTRHGLCFPQCLVMRVGGNGCLGRDRSRKRRIRYTAGAARGESGKPVGPGDHVVTARTVVLDELGSPCHRHGLRGVARTGNSGTAGDRIILAASGIGECGRRRHGESRSHGDTRGGNPVSDGLAYRPQAACDRGG